MIKKSIVINAIKKLIAWQL